MLTGVDLEIVSRPVDTRELELGRFEVFHLAGRTFGLATYEPGWRWAEHVGRQAGQALCQVEHLGLRAEQHGGGADEGWDRAG